MNSLRRYLGPCIDYALYFGLFVLVAGFFISYENSKYHTNIYLGFYIPALAALLYNARTLVKDLVNDRVLGVFTLWMLWLGVTTLWTPFEDTGHLIKILMMLWVLVLAVRLMMDNMRYFNIALTISLGIATVVLIVTLVDYLSATGIEFYRQRLWQIGGRTMSAVTVGQICAIFMLFCLMQARLVALPWLRNCYWFMTVIFLLPVILSFSRTAIMALSLTALWYYFQRGNTRLVVLLVGLSALMFIAMLLDVENEWLTNISRSVTFEIRVWGWKATWEHIQQNWLLGYGIRAPYEVTLANTPFVNSDLPHWHPHNLFLSVWYYAGLPGLLLLLTVLGLIAAKIRPLLSTPELRYWSCIFIFVLLICLVDSPGLIDRPSEPWIWFWLPLAIAINAEKIAVGTTTNHVNRHRARTPQAIRENGQAGVNAGRE